MHNKVSRVGCGVALQIVATQTRDKIFIRNIVKMIVLKIKREKQKRKQIKLA